MATAKVEISKVENTQEKTQVHKLQTLRGVRGTVKKKINEDIVRFRTCCADPRASK